MSNIKEISIVSWNIHGNNDALEGPKNKNQDVYKFLMEHSIFCLQETKTEFNIQNYRCLNKNRTSSASGGVCIGIHRSLEKHVCELITESDDFQAIKLCGLLCNPRKDLVIVNVYDSPMTSSFKRSNPENCNTLEDLTTFIMKLSDAEIIVAGDFNARTGSNNFESNETLNNWNNN